MNKASRDIAIAYYTAMKEKNIDEIAKYLHHDVQFTSPLAKKTGKDAVIEAVKGFMAFFKALAIRTAFNSSDQAMVVYDVVFPDPIGCVPSAALIDYDNGLITRIELFFDARSF